MQFLVISRRLTEKFSDAEFEPIVPLEGARARYLHSIGFTRQIGTAPINPALVKSSRQRAWTRLRAIFQLCHSLRPE
ncbi:hypothetical protein LP421_33965 (plasmid) [Rhizobium sp. RCAM05350]|uniref:hypothetical protein n=1 Tax=Rhizobium sp. RCAM05350 TaxID=2895568 RepID=UPI0020766C65|nr:hypothetical protein [Rhizobium sp. RCAM05350]URK89408.1 hypothetical protein LP421_33965 [Rhizobium sp. RCAM05350]